MKKIGALVLSAAFLLTAIPAFAQQAMPTAPPPPPPPAAKVNQPGMMAPAWTTKDVETGKDVSSEELKGKPYALIFVNSSCSACRRELTKLGLRNFGDRLKVMVVAVDARLERVVKVYRENLKVQYQVIADPEFDIAQQFGIGFTPASVIVGADGKVEAWIGGFTKDNEDETLTAFDKYVK